MAMVAVTTALIAFFAFVIMRVTTPLMTTLYTDLNADDASGIIKDLERQAIPFELRNDGAVIMVPKDKVTRLRMKLAEGGLPKGGGVGYEIFDKSDALGTTSFVQNINHLRALEGELARTIRAIDRVQAARVHLVLPERPLFSRETPEPSASIVVRVRGSLEPQQIKAIRHLVASAVNGLKPQRVSIVDEAGQLLADGATGDADNAIGDERRDFPRHRRQTRQIENQSADQNVAFRFARRRQLRGPQFRQHERIDRRLDPSVRRRVGERRRRRRAAGLKRPRLIGRGWVAAEHANDCQQRNEHAVSLPERPHSARNLFSGKSRSIARHSGFGPPSLERGNSTPLSRLEFAIPGKRRLCLPRSRAAISRVAQAAMESALVAFALPAYHSGSRVMIYVGNGYATGSDVADRYAGFRLGVGPTAGGCSRGMSGKLGSWV